MQHEYIASGKTVSEAVDNAIAKLKIDRAKLSFEVLETPSKGFLVLAQPLQKSK